jgi:4-hydroxybenzoate polyprenyltransferase
VTALRVIAEDIKIAHSIFALPFAVLAAFMAAQFGGMPFVRLAVPLGLVVVAMVFARTAAMLSNRILDHRIDAGNPRTSGRAIPSGRLSVQAAGFALAISSLGFLLICGIFGVLRENWLPLALGVPVLAWICAYGYFKRFTWLCHLWLGASLALSPIASAIAVDPASLSAPPIWLLAGMVLCWVSGFDVIYALQDVDVDRRDGLKSIPVRFGVGGAMNFSRVLHLLAIIFLFAVYRAEPAFGPIFLGASILVAVLLIIEHATVHRWGTTRMAITFMTINGIVSIVVGTAGAIELLRAGG